MDDPLLRALVLAAAGLVAGIVNTLAGGGSLLALPALIFSGLPADVANATNRVGVLLQSSVGIAAHHGAGQMPWRRAPLPLLATSAGATAGAFAALELGRDGIRPVIAAVLVLALPIVFVDPARLAGERRLPAAVRAVGFVAAGAYGGFVQAGVGVVLLAVLFGLGDLSLVRANALKLLLVGVFTIPPLIVFASSGIVAWAPGLALAAGSMLGGWCGSHLNLRGGQRLVRGAVAAVVLASAVRLLWAT